MPYRSVTSAEICCHNSTCWHGQLYPLSAKLRALLGPAAIFLVLGLGALHGWSHETGSTRDAALVELRSAVGG